MSNERIPALLCALACSLALPSPAGAQDDDPRSREERVPDASPAPEVSLYAQLAEGVLLREREHEVDVTLSQRFAIGVAIERTWRVGAVLWLPTFRESAPSWETHSTSFFGGIELSARARLDALVVHAGAGVLGGAGDLPVLGPDAAPMRLWPAALAVSVHGAIGLAAWDNTDLLLRIDLGGRFRDGLGPDFVGQAQLVIDWH